MNKEERDLQVKLEASHGTIAFATAKRCGPIACTMPDEERYLELLNSVAFPGESSGVAREQFICDLMVYPSDVPGKARARRFLQALPGLVGDLSRLIEVRCCGEYEDSVPTDEERAELDAKYDFGWALFTPAGCSRIVLATDPTAGAAARRVFDARELGSEELGKLIRTAVLTFVKSDKTDAEQLISSRPAILVPLWARCCDLAGVGTAELGKG